MRTYLAAHAAQLRAAWEARLAGSRQRGIVLSAGGGPGSVSLANAFVTLHVLRAHLASTLPAAVMCAAWLLARMHALQLASMRGMRPAAFCSCTREQQAMS